MAGRRPNPKTSQRTVTFTSKEIEKLPDDKPVVYRILTDGGRNNYTGIAQRGRVQDRLREHLAEGRDPVPGSRVRIEQAQSITDARGREERIIARQKPRYNERGK